MLRACAFRPVGVIRRFERIGGGDWRDGLLMDPLAEEVPPAGQSWSTEAEGRGARVGRPRMTARSSSLASAPTRRATPSPQRKVR